MAKKRAIKNTLKQEDILKKQLNEYKSMIQRIIAVYIGFIAIALPLFLSSSGYINTTATKTGVFVISTVIMASLIAIVGLIMAVSNLLHPIKNIKENWRYIMSIADIAIVAYLVVMTISALFSEYPSYAIFGYDVRNDGLLMTVLYVAVYFLISRLYKFKKWHIFLFIGASAIVSIITILQFYDIDLLGIDIQNKKYFAKRMLSTIGNLNFLSWYSAMMFVMTSVLFIKWKNQYSNWLLLPMALQAFALFYVDADSGTVAIFVSFAALFFTLMRNKKQLVRWFIALSVYSGFTLSALCLFSFVTQSPSFEDRWIIYGVLTVATIIGAVIVALQPKREPRPNEKGHQRIFASLVAVIIIMIVFLFYSAPEETFSGFLEEIYKVMHGDISDDMGTSRFFVWKRSIELFMEKPILGTGQDTFGVVFMDRFGQDVAASFGEEAVIDKAHNVYLQMLVCTGVLGLASFLTFLVTIIIYGIKKAMYNPFAAALVFGIISYSVQAFFVFTLPLVAPIFWIFAGMLMAVEVDFSIRGRNRELVE